jgi:anti-sigma28 factor (negative regulator of flagellin synthesis)
VVERRSKVRLPIAELCGVTLLARSNLSAQPCAEIRLARETCRESRILALRTAIAVGRYRIDSQAIAAKLIAAIDPHFQSIDRH